VGVTPATTYPRDAIEAARAWYCGADNPSPGSSTTSGNVPLANGTSA
jgi:hypothetical protein